MSNTLRTGLISLATILLYLVSVPAVAQLPPDAVDLAEVKIPQKLATDDLCPVSLQPSSAEAPSWTWEGVAYRGCSADDQAAFDADPAAHAAKHSRELWVLNFMEAMSTIWCPITDEVTPGGRKRVDGLGYTWESCCSFCDEEMSPENFTDALDNLRSRAEESFELTGGVYNNDAKSPVEGAIKDDF